MIWCRIKELWGTLDSINLEDIEDSIKKVTMDVLNLEEVEKSA